MFSDDILVFDIHTSRQMFNWVHIRMNVTKLFHAWKMHMYRAFLINNNLLHSLRTVEGCGCALVKATFSFV